MSATNNLYKQGVECSSSVSGGQEGLTGVGLGGTRFGVQVLSEAASGLSQARGLTSSCSTSLDEFTPIFTATNAATPNSCAYCKTSTTSGCWRRGWSIKEDQSANLCNRCGLRYKANKLEGHEFDPSQVKPRKRTNSKTPPENQNQNSSLRKNPNQRGLKRQRPLATTLQSEDIENEYEYTYTAYCKQDIQFDENKYQLFYVKDVNHKFRLLVAGIQLENGNFLFKTVPQPETPAFSFHCEEEVVQWLKSQGASILIQNQRNFSKLPSVGSDFLQQLFEKVNSDSSEIVIQRQPVFVKMEEKFYVQEGKQFMAFYLIDDNGRKCLAVNGAQGLIQAHPFVAMESFGSRRFRNEQEVRFFLQQIINNKQISNFQMEEQIESEKNIQEIIQTYQDSPDLLHWVMKQPQESDVRDVQDLLFPLVQFRSGGKSVTTADKNLVLKIIDGLDSMQMNLKLLEQTGLAAALSALKFHQDEQVRTCTRILCDKWRNTTIAALERANTVLNQQTPPLQQNNTFVL